MKNLEWYHSLIKPEITPPEWVFAPMWVALYIMMFLSLGWFLRTGLSRNHIRGTILWGLQLVLNLCWSPIFFGLHKIFAAFVIICLMWAIILWTIIEFGKISKFAAILLVPYFLWTSLALYLNYKLLVLN